MKTESICIIEYTDNTIHRVETFSINDVAGAEKSFKEKAMRAGMVEQNATDCINDGIFETGDYQIFIVNSY